MTDILDQLSTSLQQGDYKKVQQLTDKAIKNNVDVKQILDNGLIAGMQVIGEQFRKHEIFLPEVLMAAKAMNTGMELIKPLFIRDKIETANTIVIGTVSGDLHDIGKNLAGIMLKGAGFDVIDLGNNVSAEKFVETALDKKAKVIGMSALLTTTMLQMKNVVDLLKQKSLHNSIKTIIGGAPVSENYAQEIGADAYAYDAAIGVERVKQLLQS